MTSKVNVMNGDGNASVKQNGDSIKPCSVVGVVSAIALVRLKFFLCQRFEMLSSAVRM